MSKKTKQTRKQLIGRSHKNDEFDWPFLFADCIQFRDMKVGGKGGESLSRFTRFFLAISRSTNAFEEISRITSLTNRKRIAYIFAENFHKHKKIV